MAANLHRCMQPGQAQIWAVLRKEDSLQRIGYSLAAAMLGAMCISGDVTELTAVQWQTVDRGITFYRRAAEIIRRGTSYRFGPEILSYNTPRGWQCLLREGENDEALAVFHQFGCLEDALCSIPWNGGEILAVYDCCRSQVTVQAGMLQWRPTAEMSAVAVLLKR